MVLDDRREGVADGLAGTQIVLLGEQFGGAGWFVGQERTHGQFGQHDGGRVAGEDGRGQRHGFHPSRFHPKARTVLSKKYSPNVHGPASGYMKTP